jgi:hypothetical protein
MHYHGAGSTYRRNLASLNKPTISDIPKLGYKRVLVVSLTRWDRLSVCFPFAFRETNQKFLDL